MGNQKDGCRVGIWVYGFNGLGAGSGLGLGLGLGVGVGVIYAQRTLEVKGCRAPWQTWQVQGSRIIDLIVNLKDPWVAHVKGVF